LLLGVQTELRGQDEQTVYRVINTRAAPGQLVELIDLFEDRAALYRSLGEEPGFLMRHSQGDQWDLMLLQPIGGLSEYYARERLERFFGATAPSGRTGAELSQAISQAMAWREDTFAVGPAADVVASRFDGAGLFHIEMFIALSGKRAELLEQRRMENVFLTELGRAENLIFERVAGAAWDSFTIGFYEDLRDYADAGVSTPEDRQRAALAAGFEGSDRVGTYLRELIASHHDTLAVPTG